MPGDIRSYLYAGVMGDKSGVSVEVVPVEDVGNAWAKKLPPCIPLTFLPDESERGDF